MRIKGLHVFFTILFILLGGFLYYLQIVKAPLYKDLSYRNSIRLLNIPAPRGVIYDRHNKVIAGNEVSFGVFIVPQEAEDIDDEIAMLSNILDVQESVLKKNYKRNYYAPFAPCELIRGISKREAILVEETKVNIPGVLVKEIPSRIYPYKEAFAHIIGYIGEIGKSELELLKSYGYNVKDLIGKDGIERVSDNSLRGRNGGMQIQIDNRGHQAKILNFKKAVSGRSISLTLDAGFQNLMWNMMKNRKGAAIFMDPHTGEILSMVSSPSYDSNKSVASLLNDEDSPLLNRAIMGQYPPGSLFKIIVALAGLESGKLNNETTFTCRGKLDIGMDKFSCWNRDGHGDMVMEDAIIESCNVYFYNAGILLGVDRIYEYARQLGFSRPTGIELFGEMEGLLPSRMWKRMYKKENWYTGDTANLSIGQGYLLATPLQVVRMMACVANGGVLVEPRVLKKIGDNEITSSRKRDLKIKSENLDLIRKSLKGVVEDENGTGFRAWNSLTSVSGKTGSSQAGEGSRSHAWFAGFAPSENPEVSFVIFLEHGGSGGDFPALIAKKAVKYWHIHKDRL